MYCIGPYVTVEHIIILCGTTCEGRADNNVVGGHMGA